MEPSPDRPATRRGRIAAVAVIVVAVAAGGAARLGTADWGLPYNFHVDEKGFVVWEALHAEWRGLTAGDWRPRINTYGPLVFEIAVGVKWMLTGGPDRAREVARRYEAPHHYVRGAFDHLGEAPFTWPELFFALRLVSALAGTAAIALLALAAWRLAGLRAGAWTAVLAACCVALIQVGHFYTPGALLVLEIAMLLHASARLVRGGGLATAAYAGVALGLMAATKMPALPTAGALPIAIAAAPRSRRSQRQRAIARHAHRALAALATGRFVTAVLVAAVVFAVLNPWAIFTPERYFGAVPPNRDGFALLQAQFGRTEFGFYDWRFPYNGTTPFLYYFTHVLPWGLGVPALAAAAAGVVAGLWRRRVAGAIALAATVPPVLLVGAWGVKTLRYVLPAVPGLLLAAGLALALASSCRPRRRWQRVGLRAAGAAAGAWTVAYGVAFTLMFAEPDPRAQAARWIAEHARAGDVVVTEPEASYTAPLGRNRGDVGVRADLKAKRPPIRARRLWRTRPADVARHLERKLSDARFLVVGEFYLRRAFHDQAPERAPRQRAFYEALRQGKTGFRRVAHFPRDPSLGPLTWSEQEAEILCIAFDHPGIAIYERRAPYRSPLDPGGSKP